VTASDPAGGLPPGLEERYSPVGLLGRGGFGAVWLARDRTLGRLVAIKRLEPGRLSAAELGRFAREALLTARIEHPGVVRVARAWPPAWPAPSRSPRRRCSPWPPPWARPSTPPMPRAWSTGT
jgi:hypothetical protein